MKRYYGYCLLPLFVMLLAGCTDYAVEKDGVYYKFWNEGQGRGRWRIDADPETFESIGDGYGKDRQSVFYKGNPVPGADPATFTRMDGLYSKDRYRGYYAGDSIAGSRGADLRVIDSYYSTDGLDIFYETSPLHVCNTEHFRIFDNKGKESEYQRWSTDGCHYFFMNFKIPSDDYAHVELFRESAGFAKDRRQVYFMDRKLNVDYDGSTILDTVDVATFTVTDYIECRDRFGCINPYQGRKSCD